MTRVHIPTPAIYTTDEWGAVAPKAPPQFVDRPVRTIFHHTAGHHPEIANPLNESRVEAFRYAQEIQRYHMVNNGWNDSGHNFLICRNGMMLVGRHESLPAVREGRMVVSAHCPGQNDQPGVEHEHNGRELMTTAQLRSSIWLHAWIIQQCGMAGGHVITPHSMYFPTSCPGVLLAEMTLVRRRVDEVLSGHVRLVDL